MHNESARERESVNDESANEQLVSETGSESVSERVCDTFQDRNTSIKLKHKI